MPLASLPSPTRGAWQFGPITLRAQALAIVAGIIVAIVVADRRYRRAGGSPGVIADIAAWAVPAGLLPAAIDVLAARAHGDLWRAVHTAIAVAGFPGAVALGLLAAWAGCRGMRPARPGPSVPGTAVRAGGGTRTAGGGSAGGGTRTAGGGSARGGQDPGTGARRDAMRPPGRRIRFGPVLTAVTPAIAFGSAVARIGDWFAQRGFGRPSGLPWAVAISPMDRPLGYENFATFAPIFLYQAVWDAAAGFAVAVAATRWSLSGNRVFALGAIAYAAAGFGLYWLGIAHLPMILGLRAGELGDALVLVGAAVYLARTRRTRTNPNQSAHKSPLERDASVM